MIPFVLFALAVAGLLHANDIWHDHLEPQLRANVSPSVFTVINNGVNTVFAGHRVLWATFGGALALWQISGAVRAVMGALSRVYEAPTERSFRRHYGISFVLSLEVGVCYVLIAACLLFVPIFAARDGALLHLLSVVARLIVVAGLLWMVVGLLVRHAPACPQPAPWVSLGAAIVITTWLIVSLVFYIYLTDIASYQSVFGSLAAVIVAMAYLYVSTTVFLFGAQLDAIIRFQATGHPAGDHPDHPSQQAEPVAESPPVSPPAVPPAR